MELTKQHITWWRRLRRTLKDMPPDMEILVSAHGHISAAERGASAKEFQRKGDVDNVPSLNLETIFLPGIENNGSSL